MPNKRRRFTPAHLSPEELTATVREPIARAEQRVALARVNEIAANAEARAAKARRVEAEAFLQALATTFPVPEVNP
jgi:hypothetical protein